jgi:hypothetical protein
MRNTRNPAACAIALLLALSNATAQTQPVPSMPRLEKQGTATQLIVDGKPLLMLAGELHNSSTSDVEYMKPIWPRLAAMNLNTVIAAVSWELIEPVPGRFDFTLVDSMLDGARSCDLRLVLLWFGSWKNGASTYIPSWVKRDFERYPRAKDQSGKTLEVLSTFSTANRDADARAFAALMRHLRKVDGRQHTVVMIQVENEVGVLNAPRDFSPVANSAFSSPIPSELGSYLARHKDELIPELRALWRTNGSRTPGTWEEVFGKSTVNKDDWKAYSYFTEEIFMAWNYARYIQGVVAAGKAEYPLPMYVNAWLKQPGYAWPGAYPSGGPLPQVMDIWRAGAPDIDFIAPDIYMQQFEWICGEYHESGNPLFIPETQGGAVGAARVLWAIGRHDAMGFSPFGIDSAPPTNTASLSESYAALSHLAPLILENQGKDRMTGALVSTEQPTQQLTLGEYRIQARLSRRGNSEIAGAIIISDGPDEFVVAGRGLDIFFEPQAPGDRPLAAIDFVDELGVNTGKVSSASANGKLVARRRLNGDEVHTSTFDGTGLRLGGPGVSIQRVKLYRYR